MMVKNKMKVALAAVVLLAAGLIVAPAQAGNNNDNGPEIVSEWYSWVTTLRPGVITPHNADDVMWPQMLAGRGKLTPPCGVWFQVDRYAGTRNAIKNVVKDGALDMTKYGPEDRNIVKEWYFVYGGVCPTDNPEPEPSVTPEPTPEPSVTPEPSPEPTPTDEPKTPDAPTPTPVVATPQFTG